MFYVYKFVILSIEIQFSIISMIIIIVVVVHYYCCCCCCCYAYSSKLRSDMFARVK